MSYKTSKKLQQDDNANGGADNLDNADEWLEERKLNGDKINRAQDYHIYC